MYFECRPYSEYESEYSILWAILISTNQIRVLKIMPCATALDFLHSAALQAFCSLLSYSLAAVPGTSALGKTENCIVSSYQAEENRSSIVVHLERWPTSMGSAVAVSKPISM